MMTTVTNSNQSSGSRYTRIQDAQKYAKEHGWTPLTPEDKEEFAQMVAEFTNL